MDILLVEDSATLRHAMSSYIRSAGHQSLIAASGEESLQLIETTPVDMIIMDVEMPGLNGFETTRLIREWLGDNWIPIIFVTGKSEDEDFAEGIEAGGDDYLIKPVSPIILSAKIRAMERITEMRNQLNQLNKDLEQLSQLDSLTQIFNRRTFTERARQYWQQANRQQRAMSALMIDVDHFKLYNDHYGHPAGDSCLRKVTKAIEGALQRPSDLLGRYGGEEFIVLLPETDLRGAQKVADNINNNVERLRLDHSVSPTAPFITVSIGGATCAHTTGLTLEELIKNADQQLYKAKHSNRNCNQVDEVRTHKTILIADDDSSVLQLLSSLLKQHCNIVTADGGDECLSIAQRISPDLILLDIHMPDMSGIDVCKTLKQHSSTAAIPVILMSTDPKSEQVKAGKAVGANDAIEKPIDETRLLGKVSHLLQ